MPAITDRAEWDKQPNSNSELEIGWDVVVEKTYMDVGGCHEDVPSIQTFGGYRTEVHESIEQRKGKR